MKIIIAPDKFKGSLTAFEVCMAVSVGLKEKYPAAEILQFPLADGGEGLTETLNYYLGGHLVKTTVSNPLFKKIVASYGISKDGKIAFIEMAAAAGLVLLKKSEQNCYYTSTYGTGEMILDAIAQDVKEIILGIGGSATNDAGIGMAAALGYRFLDKNNKDIKPIGKNLNSIDRIDDSELRFDPSAINIKVACDVSNPLYGKKGAAYVYAKQKGAALHEIEQLDNGLKNFASKVLKQYKIDVADLPGAGAAGGMGAGCVAFLNARLISGTQLLIEKSKVEKQIKAADLIITGEGKIDDQTFYGKVVSGVCYLAKKYKKPVIGIAGISTISQRALQKMGLKKIYRVIDEASSIEDAISNAQHYLKTIASKI